MLSHRGQEEPESCPGSGNQIWEAGELGLPMIGYPLSESSAQLGHLFPNLHYKVVKFLPHDVVVVVVVTLEGWK